VSLTLLGSEILDYFNTKAFIVLSIVVATHLQLPILLHMCQHLWSAGFEEPDH
jgi:hypothetical protein